jgi:hypothetical protein
MDIKLRKEFLADVEAAIVSAERKHTKVCDVFVTHTLSEVRVFLEKSRIRNDANERNNEGIFLSVLQEEMLEAIEAYLLDDYKQCIKELAQIAAVAVRGMEFVYRLTPEAKASAKFKGGAND